MDINSVMQRVKSQQGLFSAEKMTDGGRVEGFLISSGCFYYIATVESAENMVVGELNEGHNTILKLERVTEKSIQLLFGE